MRYFSLIIIFACSLFACREKYTATLKPSDKSALVVEGFLNGGTGPTTITLTRSYSINSPGIIPRVGGAQVTVEGDNGTSFSLAETGVNTGVYRHLQLNLVPTNNYRLRIRTTGGKEYLSEYVPVKLSQPIDSVNWKWENNGVMVYASTHDASNNSRYYRWDYEETWEIATNYYSDVRLASVTPITVVTRAMPQEDVSRCWKYDVSRTIMIGSTAQLQSDVVFQAPLYYVPANIEKLGVRYSTLIKQSVLTKEAYEYFALMKKNTEQLGSIFDPLPSELRGNIKCLTDPDEQVIGFVTASSQQTKRIFINSQEIPDSKFIYINCDSKMVPIHPDTLRKYLPELEPYAEFRDAFNILTHYFIAQPPCFDCTKRNGNTTKPSYW